MLPASITNKSIVKKQKQKPDDDLIGRVVAASKRVVKDNAKLKTKIYEDCPEAEEGTGDQSKRVSFKRSDIVIDQGDRDEEEIVFSYSNGYDGNHGSQNETQHNIERQGNQTTVMVIDQRNNRRHDSCEQDERLSSYKLAILYLMSNMNWAVIDPMIYLQATGELWFLTLVICWITTNMYNPDNIMDNPYRDRLGYSNICVGWDTPPASRIGAVGWIVCCYCGLTFCYLDTIRTNLNEYGRSHQNKCQRVFKYSCLILYAVSLCSVMLIFFVTPQVDISDDDDDQEDDDEDYDKGNNGSANIRNVWVHTCIYLFLVMTWYLVVLSIYLEYPKEFQIKDKIFLFLYGICSFSVPALTLWQYWLYDVHHRGRHPSATTLMTNEATPIPAWALGSLDYLWFVCMMITSRFIPGNQKIWLMRTFQSGFETQVN